MKNLFLSALLTAGLGQWAFSQSAAPVPVLDSLTRALFTRLDKSAIGSGILIHQSPVFIAPCLYDGANLADSTRLDAGGFGRLYGQFRAAAIGASYLPDPAVYLNRVRRLRQTLDTIPLALLFTRWHYIPPQHVFSHAATYPTISLSPNI